MKKLLIFIMLLMAIVHFNTYGQNRSFVDDALFFSRHTDTKKTTKVFLDDDVNYILKYYYHTDINDSEISSNPFLKEYFTSVRTGASVGDFSKQVQRTGIEAVGGLDVTNVADGLARFLVKRTKEELNVAFFSKFKELLNKPEYRDLKTLFPGTWELLAVIGEEIYDYNKYLQNLREAFKADLRSLDEQLPGLIPNHKVHFENHFEQAVALNTSCYLSGSIREQMHPGDIIDQFPLKYLKKTEPGEYFDKNWSGAFLTLKLFNLSLRDPDNTDGNYWISGDSVRKMISDPDAFRIYLGLIYEAAKNEPFNSIQFKNGKTLIDFLNSIESKIGTDAVTTKSLSDFLVNLVNKTSVLSQMIREYSTPANDSAALENYARYFRTTVDLLEYCTRITDIPKFKEVIGTDLSKDLKDYFEITYTVTDLAIDINRRNYPSAVNHTVILYNLIINKVLEEELAARFPVNKKSEMTASKRRALNKYLAQLNSLEFKDNSTGIYYDTDFALKEIQKRGTKEKSYNEYIDDLKKLSKKTETGKDNPSLINSEPFNPSDPVKREIDEMLATHHLIDSVIASREILNKLTRYGTFIASVATAKTSEEVADAIESAALPAGSSRIKRETPFNVSLNAYTGIYGGHEDLIGYDDKKFFNTIGLSAPVGVAVSWGKRDFFWITGKSGEPSGSPIKEKGGHWSYSIFTSFIDIGALASFRFQDDSVAQVPSIQLGDIFSPGLFFSLGIPKCPVSVNIGAQIGPNLREVNFEDPETGEMVNKYQDQIYIRYSAALVVDIPLLNFYTKSDRLKPNYERSRKYRD